MDIFPGIICLLVAALLFLGTYFQWWESFFMYAVGIVGSIVLIIMGLNLLNGAF